MAGTRLRISLMGVALAIALPLQASAAGVAASEQQRMEQAFASKLEADQQKAQDKLIAGKTTALLNDPATPVIGNPKADVAVIEFFDYTCPYCKAVEPRIQKLLKDDKNVKLVVKEFPILTPESLVASKVALAAAKQGKYEEYHQALMNFKGRLTNDVIFDTAKEVGLDVPRLRKDMQAPEVTDAIIANFNLARGLRIFQTPAFIVGGHMLTGASSDIDFPKVVAAARGK
ncbi:MAG TPA: DsbA family protein [Micropepsaceae bacterium]|jgi:protein-disulfide isomerase|nr:DsbA family protein [Micropepsaceae bacterium]